MVDNKQKRLLEARILDAIKQCENQNTFKFLGFIDSLGLSIVSAVKTNMSIRLFGGYDDAERVFLGVFPPWCEPDDSKFPIVKLKIKNMSNQTLSHRDILGAFMSVGIERDTIGDILVGDSVSVAFVADTVADYIVMQVEKIASSGVKISIDDSKFLPNSVLLVECSGTISSPRLDCVIAEIIGCSRKRATELIEAGMVAVNGIEMVKITATVHNDDKISVRKKGKFIIDNISELTKKGRIALKYRKYT